jgi:uncharacterized protein YkwD
MRNWNGFLASVAVLLALVVLAGCGGDDESAPAASTPEATATTDTSGPVEAQVTGGETGEAVTANSKNRGARMLGTGGKITGKAKKKGKKGEVSVGAGASCPDVDLAPSDANLPQIEAAILCLVNGERQDNGRSAVASNGPLKDASLKHSKDMVDNTFFAHESPSGSTLVSRVEPTGYIPADGEWVLGENLAFGTGALATPKAIVQGWMDSPGHRENLLNPDFKDVGIGIVTGVPVEGRSGGATYTTDYGAKGTAGSGDSGGSGGEVDASITDDGGAGTAGKVTTSAKKKCAKRKLVAKKVRGKVRCVKKKKRRR